MDTDMEVTDTETDMETDTDMPTVVTDTTTADMATMTENIKCLMLLASHRTRLEMLKMY